MWQIIFHYSANKFPTQSRSCPLCAGLPRRCHPREQGAPHVLPVVAMGFSMNGGTPIAGWFIRGNPIKLWIRTGGIALFQEISILLGCVNLGQ